jgi:hypothetical protein
MPNITSVSYTFENGVKREEYGPTKKVAVTITAAVAELEDGAVILAQISALAMSRVASDLAAARPATTDDDATVANLMAEAAAPPARKAGRPPKAAPVTAEQAVKAAELAEPAGAAPAEPASGSAAADDWEATAPEITDKDLLSHLTKRAEELGQRQPITDLIGSFDPTPGQGAFKAQDIPQAQRADFLAKLAALT